MAVSVLVRFLPDDVTVEAQVGESFLDVAERAGIVIPTGCLMGSCHACEVEMAEVGEIRACITAVPPGRSQLTINLFTDPTW
jgi:ferredoxin